MNCQSIELLIPEYLKGTMSEEEKGGFEGHIQSCPTCREELNQMQTLWAGIKAGSQVQPGPQLRPRFYAMLDAYKNEYAAKEARPGLFKRIESVIQTWWPKRPAIQVAFSITLLVLGILIGIGVDGKHIHDNELARLHSDLQSMQQKQKADLQSMLDKQYARVKSVKAA